MGRRAKFRPRLMFKLTFKCAHCNGSGFIGEEKLPPFQRKVLGLIRAARHGIKARDLAEQAYADDKNGGSYTPLISVQNAIRALNRRMQQGRKIIKTTKHKPYYRYLLVNTSQEQADGVSMVHRRDGFRRKLDRAADGGPADRKAE